MIFRRPSLGWAKAKLPARTKPASAEIAHRITAPPRVRAILSSKDAIGASPAERSDASLSIGRSRAHEHADAPHPLALLRACRQRPRRRAAQQRDERAPPHVGHWASSSALPVCRTLNLLQGGRKILGPDLNCSESGGRADPPVLPSKR